MKVDGTLRRRVTLAISICDIVDALELRRAAAAWRRCRRRRGATGWASEKPKASRSISCSLAAIDRDDVAGILRFAQAPDGAVIASEPLRLVGDAAAGIDLVQHVRRLGGCSCAATGPAKAIKAKLAKTMRIIVPSRRKPDHPRLCGQTLSARSSRARRGDEYGGVLDRSQAASGRSRRAHRRGLARRLRQRPDRRLRQSASARSISANQGEPLSLDPHKASGTWENNIIGNMFVGLTTENAKAEPIPGMAERWETSEDGRTWTFHLRRAQWSDGEACDAHDFEFALQAHPRSRRTSPNTRRSSIRSRTPRPINSGRHDARHKLGVTALDDLTLEIQLEHPAPYLPQLLKHYTAYPGAEARGRALWRDWVNPDNIVVNGAFTLIKWWSNYIVHLERNPRFFDAANVVLEHLYFYPSTDVNAAARKVMSGEAGWSTRFPSNQVEAAARAICRASCASRRTSCAIISRST